MSEHNSQPFLLNPQTGREYYGKALGINNEEIWTDRPYESGYDISNPYLGRIAKVAGLAAGYGLLRSSPWAWENATQLARVMEDVALPYKWGRTFQISNIMSHKERLVIEAGAGKGTHFPLVGDIDYGRYISQASNNQYSEAQRAIRTKAGIKELTPEEVLKDGVTFKQGKLYLGKDPTSKTRVIGEVASLTRTSQGASAAFTKAYTHIVAPGYVGKPFNIAEYNRDLTISGRPSSQTILRPTIGGQMVDGKLLGADPVQIIFGKTKTQYHLRRAAAIGAEFGIYRFNRLLTEDFTTHFATKPIAELLKKIPGFGKHFDHGLGVTPGTPLGTAARLGTKLAMLGTVAPLAYSQVDWMTEKLIGTGITEGLASAYVGTRLTYAHALDFLEIPVVGYDVYDLQEDLENWVPGVTSPLNIVGFGLTGFVGGSLAGGIHERRRGWQRTGAALGDIDFAEKYKFSREQISERYTGFNFEPENKVGKFFERWGTGREGSVFAEDLDRNILPREPVQGWRKIPSGARQIYENLGDIGKRIWQGLHTIDPKSEGVLELKLGIGKAKVSFGRATTGKLAGMMGAALTSPFWLGGLLGAIVPDERPEELEDIFAGRQEIPVRRGRFWEFGRGSYEGDDIMYYRPHWYSRLKSKSREKGIWEDEYDLSPIKKFYLKEFTYHLEEKHYNSRPYPITALPLEEVPFLGPILSNTIGRLIKPPMSMHGEEWKDEGTVKVEEPGFGKTYATELGETPGGLPVSPYGVSQSISKAFYNLTEQAGLWGYALETGINEITGTPGIFDQYKVMSSFRDVTSARREFYDLNLGGMFMTNEAYRRLYPAERKHIDKYNPLKNEMPFWMPGPGSKGLDFQHGDPYAKVPEGEYRLPGPGYAGRFPELEGVNPEDYPLIHQFKILADIAPHSREFGKISQQAKQAKGSFDEFDLSIYESTLEQLRVKREGREFHEYRNFPFSKGDKYGAEDSSGTLAAINRFHASRDDTSTGVAGFFGMFAERFSHMQMPWEYLFPISPESKFSPIRSSIESYERENVYGTKAAFWNKPFDNFISPALKSTAHEWLGWDGIPGGIERTRDIQEYFDTIEYVKNARLANIAKLNRDQEAQKIFEQRKDETLFGINPYTQNESAIYRALPGPDKDYFRAFSEADTTAKRDRILEIIPRNQRELYLARWKLRQTQDMKMARDGMINEMVQSNVISDRVNEVYSEAKDEGFPRSGELYQMFLQTKYPGENYSDWYRRTQLLPDVPLPRADWVGWHPSVDLEDIKLKTVMELGEDMHDHGFYDAQLRALGGKPFLDDAVDELLDAQRGNDYQSRRMINEIFSSRRIQADIGISKQWGPGSRPQVSIDLEQ